jgi:hypothetical protein
VRRQTSVVALLPDTLVEGSETVALQLSNPVGAILGRLAEATLTILDDDLGGALSFAKASYTVSETGRVATIAVIRTNGLASGVSPSRSPPPPTVPGVPISILPRRTER